jgi:hypothetical protein
LTFLKTIELGEELGCLVMFIKQLFLLTVSVFGTQQTATSYHEKIHFPE